MDKKKLNETANYIYDVIRTNQPVSWSWGFNSPHITIHQEMAALAFKVNGFLYKGWVVVAYNEGKDLYEIFTFKNFERGIIKEHVSDVFDYTLVATIDCMIETKNDQSPEYKENVEKFLAASSF